MSPHRRLPLLPASPPLLLLALCLGLASRSVEGIGFVLRNNVTESSCDNQVNVAVGGFGFVTLVSGPCSYHFSPNTTVSGGNITYWQIKLQGLTGGWVLAWTREGV